VVIVNNLIYWKCGNSAIDAEEYYSRGIGNVIEINKEEYDNSIKGK